MWHRHPRALHSKCAHTLGPRQNSPRLPLFLALKWWEQAFQNQTEVFANIFWPSCLPIFISFIFGKRKFPDTVLGIRLLSGQPVPVSHFWLLPLQGEARLRPSAPRAVAFCTPASPPESRRSPRWEQRLAEGALAPAAAPAFLSLWPLPDEQRCRAVQAAAR